MNRLLVDMEAALRRRATHGERGHTRARTMAQGDGWSVRDYLCTRGPGDRPFGEQRSAVEIAVVVTGTFQYRSPAANALLTPGALLLGNPNECFECGHEHAAGDRCVAFRFDGDVFERVAAEAGVPAGSRRFRHGALPSFKALGWVSANVAAGLLGVTAVDWHELALDLASRVLRIANGLAPRGTAPPRRATARVTASIRAIERDPGARHSLPELAAQAGLSPFHYLRTFRQVTGVTPHQFVVRTRLREAATRLASARTGIARIALDAGFEDLSNFNHAFRAEFGVAPRQFSRARGLG
jgi:AraC-like DNA-binding protein